MGLALSLLCGVLREDRSLVLALALLLCLVAQLCRTLCDPGTVAHQAPLSMGFSQARILEWVAISPGDLPQHPSPPSCLLCHTSFSASQVSMTSSVVSSPSTVSVLSYTSSAKEESRVSGRRRRPGEGCSPS